MANARPMPKDRICPLLTLAGKSFMERREHGFVNCVGEQCSWFKGNSAKVDGECAISDIAGWFGNLTRLAGEVGKQQPQPKAQKVQVPKDDDDDDDDR